MLTHIPYLLTHIPYLLTHIPYQEKLLCQLKEFYNMIEYLGVLEQYLIKHVAQHKSSATAWVA